MSGLAQGKRQSGAGTEEPRSKKAKMEDKSSSSTAARRRSTRLAPSVKEEGIILPKSGTPVLSDLKNTTPNRTSLKRSKAKGKTRAVKTENNTQPPPLNDNLATEQSHGRLDPPASNSTTSIKQTTDIRSKPEIKVEEIKSEKQEEETNSSGDESEDEMMSYEKLRERNVKDNQAFLATLQMGEAKSALLNLTPASMRKTQASARGFKEKKEREVLPRRAPSLRLQKKAPDGVDLPYVAPVEVINPYSNPERKEGNISFIDALKNKEVLNEAGPSFISTLQKLQSFTERPTPHTPDLDSFMKKIRKTSLAEERVAKVCPNRIFSLTFHPTPDKILVAAGDKWGNVGFWDVNSSEGQHGVYCFAPHVRPINHLMFSPYNSNHLYTCSYEGVVRRGDIAHSVFEEVFVNPDEDYNVGIASFDFCSAHSLIASSTDGYVYFIDARSDKTKGESFHELHPKKRIRCVNVHPQKNNYFVTSGGDGTAKIWDNRKMSDSKKKVLPIAELQHGKMVNSAYFSSVTGNKLLTTSLDNMLRIYDTSEINSTIQVTKAMRHNNHTGRWLSKFGATWHPARDDLFIIGSMNRPRQIELYSGAGAPLCELKNEDWLGSVCSLNAFHPTHTVVAGGNSSGRIHVFM